MIKDLGSIWTCDICGKYWESIKRPDQMRQGSFKVEHSGFYFSNQLDICISCFPSEYLTDPSSTKRPPLELLKTVINKPFSFKWRK